MPHLTALNIPDADRSVEATASDQPPIPARRQREETIRMAGKRVQRFAVFNRPKTNHKVLSTTCQPLAVLADNDRGTGAGIYDAKGVMQLPTDGAPQARFTIHESSYQHLSICRKLNH